MKKKLIYLGIVIASVVLFDLLFRCLANYAFSHEPTDGLTAYSYHTFSKQADILVLGTSSARYDINTDMIRDSTHKKCFNLGMDACGMYQQYASLKTVMSNGPIETVILEISPMQMRHPINPTKTNIEYFTPYYWKDDELKYYMDNSYGKKHTIRYVSASVQFSGLLFDIAVRLKNHNSNFHDDRTGYLPMAINNLDTNIQPDTCENDFLNILSFDLLNKIVNLCKSHNTRLIIVVIPAIADWSCFNTWISSYCDKNKIELLNFQKEGNTPEWKPFFVDNMHFDHRGADILAKEIINCIRSTEN